MVISKHVLVCLCGLVLALSVSACDMLKTGPDQALKASVSSVEPDVIAANTPTQIRIKGSSFRAGAGVVIAGQAATGVSVPDPSTILATTPALPEGSSFIMITYPGGPNVYQYGKFVIVGAPVISSVTPETVRAGKWISIKGTGLGAGAILTIGGVAFAPRPISADMNEMIVTIPELRAGMIDLTITSKFGDVTSRPSAFRYLGSIVAPSSSSVAAGDSMTISYSQEGYEGSWDDFDWIGIFKPGAANQTSAAVWWKYFEEAGGSMTLTAPLEPGQYEVRLLQNSTVQARTTLTVLGASGSLQRTR